MTDDILNTIKYTRIPQLQKSRDIVHRIVRRQLYKPVRYDGLLFIISQLSAYLILSHSTIRYRGMPMTLEEVKERLDEVMDDSNLQLDEDIVIIRKKIDKGGDYSEVRIKFSESQAKSFETTNERKDM